MENLIGILTLIVAFCTLAYTIYDSTRRRNSERAERARQLASKQAQLKSLEQSMHGSFNTTEIGYLTAMRSMLEAEIEALKR